MRKRKIFITIGENGRNRRAASEKMSTGLFSDSPFRFRFICVSVKQKRNCSNTVSHFGADGQIIVFSMLLHDFECYFFTYFICFFTIFKFINLYNIFSKLLVLHYFIALFYTAFSL